MLNKRKEIQNWKLFFLKRKNDTNAVRSHLWNFCLLIQNFTMEINEIHFLFINRFLIIMKKNSIEINEVEFCLVDLTWKKIIKIKRHHL